METSSLPPIPPALLWPPAPRPSWFGWLGVGGVVLALALALALKPYPRSERLSGWLAPAQGTLGVEAPRAGVLGPLLVAPGARLAPGHPVLMLYAADRTALEAEHGRVLAQWYALGQRSRQLLAEQAREREAGATLRTRLEGALAQKVALKAQVAQQEGALRNTLSPLLAPTPVQALHVPPGLRAQAQLQVFGAAAEVRRYGAEIAALETELARLALGAQQRLQRQGAEALGLRQAQHALAARLAELRQRRRWVLRMPREGRLLTAPGVPGESVKAGALLATVAPGEGALEAIFPLTPDLAGAGVVGQPVRLSLARYPAHRYGTLPGRLTRRSLVHGQAQGERLHVQLLPRPASALLPIPPLAVGMAVQGVVPLPSQSALGRLFAPFLRLMEG